MKLNHYIKILCLIIISTISFFACKKNNDSETKLKDIDGNTYNTITINGQTWMKENLKTTTYNDGTPIELAAESAEWENNISGAYYSHADWYGGESGYANSFGYLYNWYAVNTNKLCPDSWRVPDDHDWKILEMSLGMTNTQTDSIGWRGTNEGSKLAGNVDLWEDGSLKSSSDFGTSGINALPAGYRSYFGIFSDLTSNGYWWTSSANDEENAWFRFLYANKTNINRNSTDKRTGFSVRCIKE